MDHPTIQTTNDIKHSPENYASSKLDKSPKEICGRHPCLLGRPCRSNLCFRPLLTDPGNVFEVKIVLLASCWPVMNSDFRFVLVDIHDLAHLVIELVFVLIALVMTSMPTCHGASASSSATSGGSAFAAGAAGFLSVALNSNSPWVTGIVS